MGNNFNIKHIVYLTINTQNNKIYIGVHKTDTPDKFDGYLGNGLWINNTYLLEHPKEPFHYAVKKYGIKNFKRKTLKVFDNRQDALDLERQLVDEEFIRRSDTYNITIGDGDPPLLKKKVYQFDIKGTFIKEWNSETEICKFYESKVQFSDIITKKRSFAGYFWSVEKNIDITQYITECKYGFISQYNKEGVLLQTFKNATIAAQKLDLDRNGVVRAVFNKKLYNGCYYLKADVDIAEVLSNKYKPTLGKCRVYQYNLDGTLLQTFETLTAAVESLQTTSREGIKKAMLSQTQYKGFYWAYKLGDNYFSLVNPGNKPEVKIAQYDLNNQLIKIWNSPKEVKKEFPYALQVCQGKAKSTKNYVFKYV